FGRSPGRIVHALHVRVLRRQLSGDFVGSVGRRPEREDYFELARIVLREDRAHGLPQMPFLVEHGEDGGDRGPIGHGHGTLPLRPLHLAAWRGFGGHLRIPPTMAGWMSWGRPRTRRTPPPAPRTARASLRSSTHAAPAATRPGRSKAPNRPAAVVAASRRGQ